jgi:hypothetical protein
MQPEEPRTETELQDAMDSDDVDTEEGSEAPKSPIDEDVASSVNAAVPDSADE